MAAGRLPVACHLPNEATGMGHGARVLRAFMGLFRAVPRASCGTAPLPLLARLTMFRMRWPCVAPPQGIARALNIFRGTQAAPKYRLADMTGAEGRAGATGNMLLRQLAAARRILPGPLCAHLRARCSRPTVTPLSKNTG